MVIIFKQKSLKELRTSELQSEKQNKTKQNPVKVWNENHITKEITYFFWNAVGFYHTRH